MSFHRVLAVPAILLMLAGYTNFSFAQSKPGTVEQMQASAEASFRQARFSEAYGRFILLADAGHAPAAAMALWMYQNGPTLFGKDWDTTQEQLSEWARLARQPAPVMVARTYGQPRPVAPRSGS